MGALSAFGGRTVCLLPGRSAAKIAVTLRDRGDAFKVSGDAFKALEALTPSRPRLRGEGRRSNCTVTHSLGAGRGGAQEQIL